MRRGTWTSLAGWVALAAAGCNQPAGDGFAVLPVHELDWSVPRRPVRPGDGPVRPTGPLAPPTAPRAWRYIVIHHSATGWGSAAQFDRDHRKRGWDELGYHFVIDNGNGGPDGRVEIGSRWESQKWGAHCGGTPGNEYNNFGIGICLVGDFEKTRPSPAQLDSLHRLVLHLAAQYGIAPANAIGHRDAPNASTKCPGRYLAAHLNQILRPALARQLAAK